MRTSLRGSELLDRAAPLLRWRYPLLVMAAAAFSLQHLRGTGNDWQFFMLGSELLFGTHRPYSPLPGGLHLYANYPEVQIGPLSLLAATPFRLLGREEGRIAAAAFGTAIAPLVVLTLERTATTLWHEADRRLLGLTAFMGGLIVVQAWSPLATIYAHLDDVLLLAVLALALLAVARHHPWLLGAALGAGMALKPWGVVALALVLALPRRDWWRAASAAGTIAAAAWMPFVIGDPGTLAALRPQALTSPASVLGLLGVPFDDAPAWVRPLQFGSALVLGALAVMRGRWTGVLLVGVSVRVGLDPEVFLYYSTGLLVAALAWDLLRSPRPLPVWTLSGFLALDVSYVVVDSPTAQAVLRLLVTIAAVAGVLLAPAEKAPAPVDA